MKEIYSFSVDLPIKKLQKVLKKKKNKDSGKIEEFTEEVEVEDSKPVKIIIKSPSRRELEEADIEFSIEMSKCIKKGILTKAMLAKKYSDTGGLLTEDDAKTLTRGYAELGDLQNKYTKLNAKPNKTKADENNMAELMGNIANTRRNIVDMETSYSSLFNHTADSKAQNKVILWYLVNLSHYQESESETIEPFFPAQESEDKIDQYYEMDEIGDKLFDLVKDKIATIISFWYYSTNATKEDFDQLNEDIDSGDV